ncbi:hypothetical protein [Micromonospora sp. NPDC049107]|uniref:hypothetical protein n=1 Tax=unclassified Micromonospora TaxID=2617518 RepID=UPI0033E6255C
MTKAVRSRRSESALQLDGQTREQLLAVVLDANAYGRARPDLTDLARMALRLHGIGVETWVPEPVAWEWAQHLAEDWKAVATAASYERKNLARAKVPVPELLYKDAGEVIEAFMQAVQGVEHVRVIAATAEHALEGLKDQIMLRAPGKHKGPDKDRVKTGASDGTWLRDSIAAADGALNRLLFLTEDKDLALACEAWGLPAPVTRKRQELRPTLFNVTVDDGHATPAVVRYILQRLPIHLNTEGIGGADSFDIGSTPSLDQAIELGGEGTDDTRVYGADVTSLTCLVGLDGVTVESGDADGLLEPRWSGDLGEPRRDQVSATVYFLGNAEATINRLHLGDDPETTSVEYNDLFIRTQLAFHFTDGVITEVSSEGDAVVSLPNPTYSDAHDAVDDIRDALSCVPGLAVPDDFGSDSQNGEHRLQIDGHNVELLFSWQPDDNWRFTLQLEGGDKHEHVEMLCEYDRGSWVGGREGFHAYDPYYVRVEEGDLASRNPIWSIGAWVVRHLDWTTRLASSADSRAERSEESDVED